MPLTPFKQSVAKKAVTAVTGLLLLGFVVIHLLGNLQIFLGADAINEYGHKLRELGELLWIARISLLTIFVVHIIFALQLAHENRRARPIRYVKQATVKATYSSRIMVITGILLLFYVFYHLGHFTLGKIHSEYFEFIDSHGRHDVYRMVVASFQDQGIAATYIAAMAAACFHFRQAIAVFPQSIGLASGTLSENSDFIGTVLATLLFIGYISIPVAVQLGILNMGGAV